MNDNDEDIVEETGPEVASGVLGDEGAPSEPSDAVGRASDASDEQPDDAPEAASDASGEQPDDASEAASDASREQPDDASEAASETGPDEGSGAEPLGAADAWLGRLMDGRYRIDEVLGEGGIGRVYRATHVKLGRPVALKVLIDPSGSHGEEARLRFEREAQTLSALNHPNIVTITDFGVDEENNAPFLVMELALGRDVESVIEAEGLSAERAFALFGQLLGCLTYAHGHGIVHRDLKPANMLLRTMPDGSDHLEVLDFGLAKFMDGEASAASSSVTRVGMIVGTPAYMAPEQIDGQAADARTDLYSAAVLFFELLAGRLPFQADTASEMIRLHVAMAPPTLESVFGRPMPEEAERFFARAFEKRPVDRYQSAGEMIAALEALSPEAFAEPPTARRSYSRAPTAIRPSDGEGFSAVNVDPVAVTPAESAPRWSPANSTTADGGAVAEKLVERVVLSARRAGGAVSVAREWAGGRRWVVPAIAGVFCLGLVAVCSGGSDPEVAAIPPGAGSSTPTPTQAAAVATMADLDAPDPWAAPLPELLAPLRARLQSGRRLSRRQIGTLRSFHQDHPDDPRPVLLHAHAYVAKGWLSHAMPFYLEAYGIDPDARGDAQMLEDLIRMSTVDGLQEEASKSVERIYGEAAIPAVRAAIAEERRAEKRERLQALIAFLEG